ncbi:MAG: DUF4917 family protein [Gammaproteobacteria bacterium]
MQLETFDEVLSSIEKNAGQRQFHVLLGNGFSMAYDAEIFSYNALHKFITNLDDEDLTKILRVIETKNFEVIMQQLDNFSALISAFGGTAELKERVDAASSKLKASLLDAVRSLHPEHVFTVPEEQSAACYKFLKIFVDTGGSLFSTNYDLLLYWILLRNQNDTHIDGFGRELENPDEVKKGEEEQWSDLIWGKHKDEQNVFYVHGALLFFDTGIDIVKEVYDGAHYLLEKINARMNDGEYPVFVTAGNGREKLTHIMHNHYLSWCYDRLCSIEGSLVTFGFNFGPYDEHIIEAINRAAKDGRNIHPKLLSIYIGVYSDEDREHTEHIKGKFRCKVRMFDAKTVDVWGLHET